MGQAKQRGTFEQRYSAAIARKEYEERVVMQLASTHHVPKPFVRKRVGQFHLALMAIASMGVGNLVNAAVRRSQTNPELVKTDEPAQ